LVNQEKDVLSRPLRRYRQQSRRFEFPLEQLGQHVAELMEILLSEIDETEMAASINAACDRNQLPKLGKRERAPAGEI